MRNILEHRELLLEITTPAYLARGQPTAQPLPMQIVKPYSKSKSRVPIQSIGLGLRLNSHASITFWSGSSQVLLSVKGCPKSLFPNNQEFQRGFSLVYLHYIDLLRSPSDYILQTSKFLCVLFIPICTWNPRQFAIEANFILRPEAGEYVFISLIANQVLEDEQRICM